MFIRYAFLSDTVSFDQAGKISAIGIFERIFAEKFPVRHRDMFLVASIEGTNTEKGEHKVSIEIRDNEDNRLALIEQQVIFEDSPVVQGITVGKFVLKFQDFVFPKPGQYQIVIFSNDRFIGRVLFAVQKMNVKRAGES